MAHDADKKRDARARYIEQRQSIPVIAVSIDVPEATVRRWKADAKDKGDNWSSLRSASLINGGGLEQLVSEVIQDFVIVHQATIEQLKTDTGLGPLEKAKVLASLSDAFQKTVGSAGRISPKISELGVAMDVLKRLADFTARHHPAIAPALLEVLEPFGEQISEIYGQ